jgi:hypothetical protein
MTPTIQRQHVLAAVGNAQTHFADIVTATGLLRAQAADRLRELVASGEIVLERVNDDGFCFPVFRKSTLWDGTK